MANINRIKAIIMCQSICVRYNITLEYYKLVSSNTKIECNLLGSYHNNIKALQAAIEDDTLPLADLDAIKNDADAANGAINAMINAGRAGHPVAHAFYRQKFERLNSNIEHWMNRST